MSDTQMYVVPMRCYNRNLWMQLTIDLYYNIVIYDEKSKSSKTLTRFRSKYFIIIRFAPVRQLIIRTRYENFHTFIVSKQ